MALVIEKNLISLPDLAAQLGLTWWATYALLTRGEFGQPERRGARWYAPTAGVRRYLRRRKNRQGP